MQGEGGQKNPGRFDKAVQQNVRRGGIIQHQLQPLHIYVHTTCELTCMSNSSDCFAVAFAILARAAPCDSENS